VLASPNGTAGVPTFRALVATDVPTLNQNTTGTAANVTGTVAIANGGTGATTAPAALTALGAYASSNPSGYTNNTGTVTSVGGTGTVSGLTLTGTVTTSGNLTLGGAITGFATSGANTNLTSVALTTGTVSTAPSSSTDIVNKSYADSIASGVNFHSACNYATTAALAANTYNNGSSGVGATLTAVAVGTLTIDGYTLVIGDVGKRLLIKNEVTQANNGVYTLTQAGTAVLPYILTRATDYDTSGSGTNEVDQGDMMLVLSGTTNGNTSWVQQTALPITIGTTALVFLQFAAIQTYTAGTGLSLSTNQFSITNVGTANTYGSATQTPVLTTNAQGQVTSVTNTTITPAIGSVTGLGTGVATFLATPTSANLATAVTDETGSGALVFATSPTLVTPILGTPQSGNFSTGTFTWPTFNQNTTGTAANITASSNSTLTTLSALSLPGSQVSGNISGNSANVTGTVAIANGGTGQTTASAGFNALSPITSTGDLIIGNGVNSATRLAIGTNGYVLTSNGTTATWSASTGGVTSFQTSLSGLTPSTATTGAVTLAGTLGLASGGSGQTTAQAAMNVFAGAVTSGSYLRGNGTNVVMSTIQAADVPTLNQNTTGTASNVTGVVAIANGGTGQTTQQAALTALSGTQTSCQYLRSNGTNTLLSAIQAADVPTLNQNTSGSAASLSTTLAVSSGGTGQTTYTDGQLLIGNSTGNTLTKATLTAGSNITITNSGGSITIASSGGGTSSPIPKLQSWSIGGF
jgi:hypothetical protein